MVRKPLMGGAFLCGCMLMLGGCVHATKAEFMQHYALGATKPTVEGNHGVSQRGQKILQVARISVPEWLEGTAMYYRLEYRDDDRVAAYAHSDWIAAPATLLEPILQSAIAAGSDWRAVTGPRNPATADASLHIRLDDFSQAFSRPHDSAGIIDATATLIDNHDDSVIAQRHFHVEVAAPTADAQGGVMALGKASRQLATDLQHWLQESTTAQPVMQLPQTGQDGSPDAAAKRRNPGHRTAAQGKHQAALRVPINRWYNRPPT